MIMQKMTKDYLLELTDKTVSENRIILNVSPLVNTGKRKVFSVDSPLTGWLARITNSDAAYLYQVAPDHAVLSIDEKYHINIRKRG